MHISAEQIAQALSCGRQNCDCGREISLGTFRTHCPSHDDEHPSFDVTQKGDTILFHCKAGCDQKAVIAALKERNLWPSRNGDQPRTGDGLTLNEFAQGKHLEASFIEKHGMTQATGKDGKPYLVFTYRDESGKAIDEATRFRFKLSERPKSKRRGKPILFGLWRLKDFRPGGEVIICEGESDTLTFWSYNLPAVGMPGKTLTKNLVSSLFRDIETVWVWQEPDAPELPGKVAARLQDIPGLTVKALIPPAGIKDISEAHCQGLDVRELVSQMQAQARTVEPANSEKRKDTKKNPEPEELAEISFDGLTPLEARQLIKSLDLTTSQVLCVLSQKAELFHDAHKTAYASVDGVTYPVNSHDFRLWLRGEYYHLMAKGPNDPAVKDALGVIESHAIFKGPELRVFVRLAELDGKIYLDLADGGKAVEITKKGWRPIDNPPVKFLRRRGMLPLPLPERGGDITLLAYFLNLPNDGGRAFRLIVSWLVAALRPCGPYPVLALTGPQGSAKTTLARILRLLIDPNSSPMRAEPKEVRDLMISARNGWVVGLDNLTKLHPWLSDAICRLSTGGGFATRELYKNDDEVIIEAMRPVVLTSINSVANAHDLADREVLIDLPAIDDTRRQGEKSLWEQFAEARPKILGALLDGVSVALNRIETISLARRPRMADFAEWATAAEIAWGWEPGSFMAAYDENRGEMVKMSIEGDLVAAAVVELMAERETWEGTPTKLLEALEDYVTDSTKKSKFWPQAANSLTRRLKRATVFLKAVGISYADRRFKKERTLSLRTEKTVTTVTSVTCEENQIVTGDDIRSPGDDIAKIPSPYNSLKSLGGDDGDDGDDKIPTRYSDTKNHNAIFGGGEL